MLTKTPSKLDLWLSTALLATAIAGSTSATHAQGMVERAGQALGVVGRGIRREFQDAFARARATVDNQEVISRVYSRLHWDRMLAGANLELEVEDGGATFLRGTVADADARSRAVALARDTEGVTLVVDELTVPVPPRVNLGVPPAVPEASPATTTATTKP